MESTIPLLSSCGLSSPTTEPVTIRSLGGSWLPRGWPTCGYVPPARKAFWKVWNFRRRNRLDSATDVFMPRINPCKFLISVSTSITHVLHHTNIGEGRDKNYQRNGTHTRTHVITYVILRMLCMLYYVCYIRRRNVSVCGMGGLHISYHLTLLIAHLLSLPSSLPWILHPSTHPPSSALRH